MMERFVRFSSRVSDGHQGFCIPFGMKGVGWLTFARELGRGAVTQCSKLPAIVDLPSSGHKATLSTYGTNIKHQIPDNIK